MPKNGLKYFDNKNNKLLLHAREIISHSNKEDTIEASVLSRESIYNGQHPMRFDVYFLNSFFKTSKSKEVFDKIVEGYELENLPNYLTEKH